MVPTISNSDARGKRVKLLDPETLQLKGKRLDIPKEQFRRICDRCRTSIVILRHRPLWWQVTCVVVLLAFVLLLSFSVRFSILFGTRDGLVMMAGGVLAIFGLVRANRQSRGPRIVQVLLDERICPQCSYSLQQLPLAPDGCTVCSECGAAWRLEAANNALPPMPPDPVAPQKT